MIIVTFTLMPSASLARYIKAFIGLRVDRSKGTPAPHKAILLLAVIESIENGEITDSKVYITPELVARFKGLWTQLVSDTGFVPSFQLPFFHLRSSSFWTLILRPGCQLLLTSSLSIRSFTQLCETVAYATLADDLFLLLTDAESRATLKQVLLQAWFGSQSVVSVKQPYLFEAVESQMLRESSAEYIRHIDQSDEEEIFVRNGVFKKMVPKIYNSTCAISGMRVIATGDVQMIDACHIVPFSESHDDTIGNGISLCPNLHRAFDRFLITIDSDMRLLISKRFVEADSAYSIMQYEGKKILLPSEQRNHPATTSLDWHRDRFIKVNNL
ncbi:MAG: HNH endonuclease [Sphingobacteriales bacterium]|nr:MAG: HNH endonuclease [Sphingobacteriales bacterium]